MSHHETPPGTGQAGRTPRIGSAGGMSSGGPQGLQFPTGNYLPGEVRTAMIEVLNRTLADTTVLRDQAKFAHWNVKGPAFYALHQLFDELAEVLGRHADEIAERATALGGQAMGTTRLAAANTRVPEVPTGTVADRDVVGVIAERLAIHDANLGEAIQQASDAGDLDTADLLNEVSREVTKYLWFLEAHLQAEAVPSTSFPTNSTL